MRIQYQLMVNEKRCFDVDEVHVHWRKFPEKTNIGICVIFEKKIHSN